MVRAAQASPDHGFCVGSGLPGLVILLAQSCARRQKPPSRARVRVGQWGSQRAQQRTGLPRASVALRYALGADGVGAARPGARGIRVTASRYALGAEGGGAARPGAYMCSPRNCARCLLGGSGDIDDVVRCALLERLGARRASSSCRVRGWGGTPRGPCCHRLCHARAERRYSGSWQEGGARAASPPLHPRSRAAGAPTQRPRAAGAPWEARARAERGQRPATNLVVV